LKKHGDFVVDKRERIPKKRRKVTFTGVLILLLLIGICAFAIFRLRLKWKLNAAIEAIRAAGYPATCAELDTWYSIPFGAENAALEILDALSFIQEWDKKDHEALPLLGRAELPARTEPLTDEMKTLIAECVTDNNEALALLHSSAEIEHCRYPVDFAAGFATTLNYLPNMRKAIMLLNLEALLHAENNDTGRAIRSIVSGFGFARSLSKEPCIISQLVRLGCHSLNLTTLERVINRADLTDGQLIELSNYLYDAETTSDMTCAFVGERCMGLSFFTSPQSMSSMGLEGIPARPVLVLFQAVGLVDMDAIIYLDIMNDQLEAARLPYPQRRKATDAIEAKLTSLSKIHILAHELTPALSRALTIETRTIARLRAARVGLAIQRYRLAVGRLPDSLAELVPTYLDAVPKDPFDGNDLRYKKRPAGFVIYSIGEDLSDDGGAERPKKRQHDQPAPKWDETFIVER
jgi:hypothetical protein